MAYQNELAQWLRAQMKRRGWSMREVAQRAGLATSNISRVLHPDEKVGFKVCRGLAQAFNVPLLTVLELAGLAPKSAPETRETRGLVQIYHSLDAEKRQDLLSYAAYLSEQR